MKMWTMSIHRKILVGGAFVYLFSMLSDGSCGEDRIAIVNEMSFLMEGAPRALRVFGSPSAIACLSAGQSTLPSGMRNALMEDGLALPFVRIKRPMENGMESVSLGVVSPLRAFAVDSTIRRVIWTSIGHDPTSPPNKFSVTVFDCATKKIHYESREISPVLVDISPDGEVACAVWKDGLMSVWNVTDSKKIGETLLEKPADVQVEYKALMMSPNARQVGTLSKGNSIAIREIPSLKITANYESKAWTCMCWSRVSGCVVAGSQTGEVTRLVPGGIGNQDTVTSQVDASMGEIRLIEESERGDLWAVVQGDRHVSVVSSKTGKIIGAYTFKDKVTCIAFDNAVGDLVVGVLDGWVVRWLFSKE